MKKRKARGGVRVRAFEVMARAIEEGVAYGWNRSRKHTDEPEPDHVRGEIEAAVLNAIREVFVFDEGDEP